MKTLLIAFIALSVSLTSFGADDWSDDLDAAKNRAKQENKHVLLLFTGTEWCEPCMELEKELLSKREFMDAIKKDFVLAKVERPANVDNLSEVERERQKQLIKEFKVTSWPMFVLMTPEDERYMIAQGNVG